MPRVRVHAYGRTEYDEQKYLGPVRTSPQPDAPKLMSNATGQWSKHSGFITTKPDTVRLVVTVGIIQKGRTVGNAIYVDDVVIKKYVQ